jgi:hypothetical protein
MRVYIEETFNKTYLIANSGTPNSDASSAIQENFGNIGRQVVTPRLVKIAETM